MLVGFSMTSVAPMYIQLCDSGLGATLGLSSPLEPWLCIQQALLLPGRLRKSMMTSWVKEDGGEWARIGTFIAKLISTLSLRLSLTL